MFTDPNAVIRITDVVGCSAARGAQDVETVAAAHLEVAQHHVEIAVVQPFDRGVAVRRFFDVVASLGQPADQPRRSAS